MRDGDTAMHHAKAQGKARHEVFETGMHARAKVQLEIENDLRRAVEREELSVHYQPIFSMKTRAVAGFEALVRWKRMGRGFVPASDFVPIAEEAGLIGALGSWVLRESCRQVRVWQAGVVSPGEPLKLSVNLSARQFAEPDLVARVTRSVQDAGLEPGSLMLEITESVLMEQPEAAAATLAELRSQQVRICIDDFGTGYSSLSYLLRFPAQTLKIDRSFVSELAGDKRHSEMIRTIVALARNLGMDVIAEGVETEDQLARLEALDCDYVQGFLLSRPLAADAAELLLRENPSLGPPARPAPPRASQRRVPARGRGARPAPPPRPRCRPAGRLGAWPARPRTPRRRREAGSPGTTRRRAACCRARPRACAPPPSPTPRARP
jgi:EAL domain-containing protein (putative c-di-GMP-specific phosphodiesterase class I)